MKGIQISSAAILLMLLFLVFSCSDESTNPNGDNTPKPPTVEQLAGTWTATKFEFTNKSNTSQKVDLVTLGGVFTLTIDSSGAYTATIVLPGEPPDVDTGVITTITGNSITIDSDSDDPEVLSFTYSGNSMTLVSDNSEFDFNDDGVETPAIATIVLVRGS